MMGQLVRSPVESAIGQLLCVADYRHSVGRPLRPRLKKPMETRILWIIRCGVMPLHADVMQFCFRQEW